VTGRPISIIVSPERVAHEINNPLAVVRGNGQLLADEVHEPRACGRIARILDAVERIKDIVVRMNDI
jgi:nitrogen-specific signal transduction histidine kinase